MFSVLHFPAEPLTWTHTALTAAGGRGCCWPCCWWDWPPVCSVFCSTRGRGGEAASFRPKAEWAERFSRLSPHLFWHRCSPHRELVVQKVASCCRRGNQVSYKYSKVGACQKKTTTIFFRFFYSKPSKHNMIIKNRPRNRFIFLCFRLEPKFQNEPLFELLVAQRPLGPVSVFSFLPLPQLCDTHIIV